MIKFLCTAAAGLLAALLAHGAIAQTVTPQGRLSLTSGKPVMDANATAQGTLYYICYNGNAVPVGGSNLTIGSCQISSTLSATHLLANTLYDVFGVDVGASTLGICLGPAWVNTATVTMTIATPAVISWTGHGLPEGAPVVFTTTGALPTGITAGTTYFVGRSPGANSFNVSTTIANAAAGTFVNTSGTQSGVHTGTNGTTTRGTGAGTTELHRNSAGLWTNANSLTNCWDNNTDRGPVSADAGTYLGTIYGTANGQSGLQLNPASATGGSNSIVGLYNAYNRVPMRVGSFSLGNWTYATTAWRYANASVSNRVTWVDGLGQSQVSASYMNDCLVGAGTGCAVGVSFNNTNSTPPGVIGYEINTEGAIAGGATFFGLGLNYAQAMENRIGGAGSLSFFCDAFGGQSCSLYVSFAN